MSAPEKIVVRHIGRSTWQGPESEAPPVVCRAIQYSDEMHCASCGLRWDTNDPEPPRCRASGKSA